MDLTYVEFAPVFKYLTVSMRNTETATKKETGSVFKNSWDQILPPLTLHLTFL